MSQLGGPVPCGFILGKYSHMALWVDKYRPTDLSGLDFHENTNLMLNRLSTSSDMPHLLFCGPSGAGKKTRIHALLKEIYGPTVEKMTISQKNFQTPSGNKYDLQVISSNVHIELTPSDVGNRDRLVVQEVIKEMAQTPQILDSSSRNFKVVVLHQADQLTKDAQHALRRTMEKFMANMRIILCCESSSRILTPIRSRCLVLRIPAPKCTEIGEVLRKISAKEDISLVDEVALKIAEVSNRDVRKAVLVLEASYVQNGNLNSDNLIESADWEIFIHKIASEILSDQSPARLAQIRSKLYELLAHCIPPETILIYLFKYLLERVDDTLKGMIIQEAAFYEHRLRLGSQSIYHLEAFIAKVMSNYKRYLLEMSGI